MKKMNTLLPLMLAAMLILSACGTTPPAQTATPAPPATMAPEIPPTDAPEPPAEPLENPVKVDYAENGPQENWTTFEDDVDFGDFEPQWIVFTTDETVTNFEFIAVELSEGDERLRFAKGETLYSLDELTADTPFAATWMSIGMLPHRGVAFTDAAGNGRLFSINMSGDDGAVFLLELVETEDGSYKLMGDE